MTRSTGDADIDRRLHESRLALLEAARVEEKKAQRLRRETRDADAIATYDHASDLYADSGLAFHEGGASDLADEVRRAIERCRKIVDNIRHPKTKRPSAITTRPNCLGCGKPLPRFKFDGKAFDDGTPREWGAYGDNRFCTLTCGWRWACGHAPMPKRGAL